jgi:hypothetical protein
MDLDLELLHDTQVSIGRNGGDLHHFVPPWIEPRGFEIQKNQRHAASCSGSDSLLKTRT